MEKIELTIDEYNELLKEGYKFIEINASGIEVDAADGNFKKEILLTAYRTKPLNSPHYVLDINDKEVKEMAAGNDTDIFFIHRN